MLDQTGYDSYRSLLTNLREGRMDDATQAQLERAGLKRTALRRHAGGQSFAAFIAGRADHIEVTTWSHYSDGPIIVSLYQDKREIARGTVAEIVRHPLIAAAAPRPTRIKGPSELDIARAKRRDAAQIANTNPDWPPE